MDIREKTHKVIVTRQNRAVPDDIIGRKRDAGVAEAVSLVLERVGKAYGARRVLRDFSLTVSGGEVIAVTGPNGSGKSTLLKIVAGLLRPSRGSVHLTTGAGEIKEAGARRRLTGYAAPDLAFYPELSARENLVFFEAARGRRGTDDAVADALARVGLAGREDDRVQAYSSGMRQRLRLAFAMLAAGPLLLLDEPSLALDEKGVPLVAEMLHAQRERGGIALLATNDSREAALGDRAVVLGT
jgi:heme exporter protein A